jgi:hypothetical protein
MITGDGWIRRRTRVPLPRFRRPRDRRRGRRRTTHLAHVACGDLLRIYMLGKELCATCLRFR